MNAFVGGTLGQERTVVPLLAGRVFHLDAYTGALTYILAFGLAKAGTNVLAGALADRLGRKPVLIVGWLFDSGPGWVPADTAGTELNRGQSAAAIWDRAEFAVQTNTTRRGVGTGPGSRSWNASEARET